MQVHLDELELARAYSSTHAVEHLSADQLRLVMTRGRELHRRFKERRLLHNAISAAVIAFLFGADWLMPIGFSHLSAAMHPSRWTLICTAIAIGAIHSWLLYSLSIYSLHEGAAHNLIFPGSGKLSRTGAFLARHMCRLATADAEQYAPCHMAHHARFGTEQDSEFLNFIFPHRFWRILLPLGTFLNYSDFFVHRSATYTRSRVVSAVLAAAYNAAYLFLLYRLFGAFCAIIVLLLLPHVGFYADRLRQFTEHNLMPLENNSGARSLGIGFWGLLVGGGPWGQPCHLAHHLVASIPWYQQIVLHRYIARILDEEQRKQFLLRPVVGYPLLVVSIVRNANLFARTRSVCVVAPETLRPEQQPSQ